MLTSASAPVGHERFTDKYFFIKRQLLFGVLPGLVAFFLCLKLRLSIIQKLALPTFLVTIILLILVFIPGIGTNLGTGSNSWLLLGKYSIQPAEFAKLGIVVFMAYYIAKHDKVIHDFKSGFLPTLLLSLIPVGLVILQPDIGTASILFAIVFGILFIGGTKWSHILSLAASGIVGFALMIVIAPYRAARLTTFLHPELDPLGIGYHINQAFLAIGSGGWLGLGLGHSRQKFEYLPEVNADSIYAVIAEEMGFIFAVALIVLLVLIAYRGFQLAKTTGDTFSQLLVGGIIIWFTVQSFLNIGAMVGILPLTGVPLPFISHGGTALAISMGAVGLLLNVSKNDK
jgi:cell division protein FtsW